MNPIPDDPFSLLRAAVAVKKTGIQYRGILNNGSDNLMTMTIYHNPRCSKSRQTLDLLRVNGHEPEVIEYLQTPPDAETLKNIIAMLGAEPVKVMRTGEKEYMAARNEVEAMDSAGQIEWLAANIRVLQRPIVVNGNRARIGRPPEAVLEILD